MIFQPRVYQELIRNFALDRNRANIFARMGMGKTPACIDIFASLLAFGESRHALVIAPKRVAVSTWPGEVHKWRESFGHLTIAAAVGTPAQRIAALRQRSHLTTVNYENVEWLIDTLGDEWFFDTVFADESTRLKGLRISLQKSSLGNEFIRGQGSLRAKKLSHVAHKRVRRWYNLTGSPAPNGLVDLWGQQWFIDAGARLGLSFSGFADRWFRHRPGSDGYGTTLEPLRFAQAEIEAAMRDCSIALDPKDWFDLKDLIERHVTIKLPPKARAAYDQMERELFAEIEENPIAVFTSAGKISKCMQIANGAVYFDSERRDWVGVHDEKIEALRSVIEEANGESVLIRYCNVPDKERILKAFPRIKLLDDNPRTIREWNEGRIPGLLTHAASAGHGLSLQEGGRILCDFSSDFNLEHDEQIIERVGPVRQLQSNLDRNVFRYRIVAHDTIEETVAIPRLKTKASLQDAFSEAMKKRH